jgi:hypothetical protein
VFGRVSKTGGGGTGAGACVGTGSEAVRTTCDSCGGVWNTGISGTGGGGVGLGVSAGGTGRGAVARAGAQLDGSFAGAATATGVLKTAGGAVATAGCGAGAETGAGVVIGGVADFFQSRSSPRPVCPSNPNTASNAVARTRFIAAPSPTWTARRKLEPAQSVHRFLSAIRWCNPQAFSNFTRDSWCWSPGTRLIVW